MILLAQSSPTEMKTRICQKNNRCFSNKCWERRRLFAVASNLIPQADPLSVQLTLKSFLLTTYGFLHKKAWGKNRYFFPPGHLPPHEQLNTHCHSVPQPPSPNPVLPSAAKHNSHPALTQ
jgi:hypothetical protein